MDLIISRAELEKAKRLAKVFGLHVRQLLEYAGDILLANDKFYQAAAMYKEARVSFIKGYIAEEFQKLIL